MNRNIKGIIFDLDGTLLDSMSVWENVDKMFLEENGIVPVSYTHLTLPTNSRV